jgi:hypothetical protein
VSRQLILASLVSETTQQEQTIPYSSFVSSSISDGAAASVSGGATVTIATSGCSKQSIPGIEIAHMQRITYIEVGDVDLDRLRYLRGKTFNHNASHVLFNKTSFSKPFGFPVKTIVFLSQSFFPSTPQKSMCSAPSPTTLL